MSAATAEWASETGVARAREMWDAGKRTEDIGIALRVSRDTIVGYARRHAWGPHPHQPWGGIHRHRKHALPQGLEPQQKAALAVRPPKAAAKPEPAVAAPKAACRPEPLAVPSPPHRQCQWIAPECNSRPWRMCGCPTVKGGAWCAEHFPRVYSRPPRWAYAPGEPA